MTSYKRFFTHALLLLTAFVLANGAASSAQAQQLGETAAGGPWIHGAQGTLARKVNATRTSLPIGFRREL